MKATFTLLLLVSMVSFSFAQSYASTNTNSLKAKYEKYSVKKTTVKKDTQLKRMTISLDIKRPKATENKRVVALKN